MAIKYKNRALVDKTHDFTKQINNIILRYQPVWKKL